MPRCEPATLKSAAWHLRWNERDLPPTRRLCALVRCDEFTVTVPKRTAT